jgi:ABC-type proline/glycine betaine transport system substrate-binding protein
MNQAIRLHVKTEMRKLQTVKTRLKKQTLLSGLQDHRRENKKDTLIRKIAIVTTGLLAVSVSAFAGDTATCKTVRFADVAWTNIQVTTGVAQVLLEALDYTPEVKTLSVPVTLAAMKSKDVDVFLGNWMPSMTGDIKPYLDDKSVEQISVHLEAHVNTDVPKCRETSRQE